MKNIRISFVLASYNGESYIDAQVRSILSSLGPDDEIIISDDGSTDQTKNIVCAIDDDRVHLLPIGPHVGYQKNFQRAVLASRGHYIFFSDQDDICLPSRIPRSLEALISYDCVCGDAIVVDQDLNETHSSFFSLRKANFAAFRLILRPAVIGATIACRRDFVFSSLPFPRGVPHDAWLSIRAATRGRLYVDYSSFILYRRHLKTASATANSNSRSLYRILSERILLLLALLGWPIRE